MANNGLWTPDGDVPIHERDIQYVTPTEMRVLAALHAVAQRLGRVVLLCGACDSAFQGGNTGHGHVWSISCKCREIRCVMRPMNVLV